MWQCRLFGMLCRTSISWNTKSRHVRSDQKQKESGSAVMYRNSGICPCDVNLRVETHALLFENGDMGSVTQQNLCRHYCGYATTVNWYTGYCRGIGVHCTDLMGLTTGAHAFACWLCSVHK